jgi:Tol biopolymer transport system component/DNA-binding winged helix-turn-helix (wHTH) protein
MVRFEFDSFQFEAETRILSRDGKQIPLAPKAAELLLVFLEHPSTLFSKHDLKLKVWPDASFVEDNNLFYQLSIVREALGPRPTGEKFIETLSKRGYRFVVPVARVSMDEVETAIFPETSLPSTLENQADTPASNAIHPSRSRWPSIRRWTAATTLGAVFFLALTLVLGYRHAPAPAIWVSRYALLTSDRIEKVEGHLFTDGARVYFREKSPNGTVFAAVPISGGATGQIRLPENYTEVYDLSPRTSEVLASPWTSDPEGRELSVVPLLGGSAKRMENLRVIDARWSPGRRLIAFTRNKGVYVANANGTGLRKVADVPGAAISPQWSPDGRIIRFSVKSLESDDISLSNTIWEVGTDGSNLHRLLVGWNNPPRECCGVWTADGKFYIFQSTREGRTDLWALPGRWGVLGGNAEQPIRLTSGLQAYSSPAAGPDEKQIFAIGAESRGELVRYDLNLKEFAPFLGGIDATWVSISRSGRYVAYIQNPDRTVWRANPDDSGKTQITFSPFEADGLSWSPDENWFAFRGRTPGKPWNIYLVPSWGGHAEPLIPGGEEQAVPAWSSDSRRIAFGDVPTIHGKPSGTEGIHIFNLSNRTVSEVPGSKGLWTARWSPDGRILSALSIQGQRLMLYEFKTNKWRPTQADNVNNPTWSRDGKYIYFDTEGHTRALRRVSLANGRVDELFNLQAYPDLSWWWSGVAPDGSPLILRNLGSNEIYSLTLDSR